MSPFGRRITRIWTLTAVSVVLLLAAPSLFDRFGRVIDPQRERAEYAQALERELRAGGERVVLPSGEVRRAVVYPRASPSEADEARHRRWLTWLLWVLVGSTVIQAVRDTWRLHRARKAESDVSAVA